MRKESKHVITNKKNQQNTKTERKHETNKVRQKKQLIKKEQ